MRFLTPLAFSMHLMLITGTTGFADPYYTAIDLGDTKDVAETTDASGQQVVGNTKTGVSYPFAIPASQPWDGKNLPGVEGSQGVTYPQRLFFTMQPFSANSQGTILGFLPSGQSRSDPWSDSIIGYTQRQPDGSNNGFHFLGYRNELHGWFDPERLAEINDKNQILSYPSPASEAVLTDLNKGTNITVSSLINPDILKQLGPIMTAPGSLVQLDEEGKILVVLLNHQDQHTVLLTQPEPPSPNPVPEPSTLITWGLAITATGLYSARRRAGRRWA